MVAMKTCCSELQDKYVADVATGVLQIEAEGRSICAPLARSLCSEGHSKALAYLFQRRVSLS